MKESLEEDRDYLLRSLDDLEREREAGDLDEADYLVLKDDYTARAAEVLRSLDRADGVVGAGAAGGDVTEAGPDGAGGGAAGTAQPGGHEAGRPIGTGRRPVVVGAPARRRSPLRPVLVGVVLLAFAAGTGALVARSAGERMPGGPVSGAITATGPSARIADDLVRARELVAKGETLAAIKLYDTVIERDAEQPEALAYRGWLLRLAGRAAGNTALVDKGMEFIERAVAADPTYPDARFFRAFVLYQDRKDPAAAVPELRAFLAGDPPAGMVAVVEDMLSRALAESQGAPAGPAAPAGPTPGPATPDPATPE